MKNLFKQQLLENLKVATRVVRCELNGYPIKFQCRFSLYADWEDAENPVQSYLNNCTCMLRISPTSTK